MSNDEFIKHLIQRGNQIKNYLVKIGASPLDAEEIVQDTLLKGMSNIESIQPEKFMSWLFKVATNQYYDLYRKEAKRVKNNVPIELSLIRDEQSPEDHFLQTEKRGEIRAVLDQIPHKYKQVLILKYEMGLTYVEIGKLLNVKPERIKTELYRARNVFRKIYEGDSIDE